MGLDLMRAQRFVAMKGKAVDLRFEGGRSLDKV